MIERVSPELAEMAGTDRSRPQGDGPLNGRANGWLPRASRRSSLPGQGPAADFPARPHIDFHLRNGLSGNIDHQWPGGSDSYVIGVKLERDSKARPLCMHETLREGDVWRFGAAQQFPAARDCRRRRFSSPVASRHAADCMAQALKNQNLDFAFHYFAQNKEQLAFPERPLSSARR